MRVGEGMEGDANLKQCAILLLPGSGLCARTGYAAHLRVARIGGSYRRAHKSWPEFFTLTQGRKRTGAGPTLRYVAGEEEDCHKGVLSQRDIHTGNINPGMSVRACKQGCQGADFSPERGGEYVCPGERSPPCPCGEGGLGQRATQRRLGREVATHAMYASPWWRGR